MNTKTTIRTSTLNGSDMTRTNVTNIKVAYRPNHTYACRFANNVFHLFRHETLLDELSNIFKCVISN